MKFPSIDALEELYPDLVRFAVYPNFKSKTPQNFIKAMKTAARMWTIERSLYEPESDIYLAIDSPSFKCATWEKLFRDRVPNYQQRTLAEFVLADCSVSERDAWQKSLKETYQIDDSFLDSLLSSPIFAVDSRTIRNHFKRLASLKQPILKELTKSRGEYQKISATDREDYQSKVNRAVQHSNSNALDIIDEGLSTITDLLLNKVNGEQRLFIHTEYVVSNDLQDRADDWANELRPIWEQSLIPPIAIEYDSASSQNTKEYVVYPVCLYYHQRAFYLCAYGQHPKQDTDTEFSWYNYRLERIVNLFPSSWDESEITQQLKTIIHEDRQRTCPHVVAGCKLPQSSDQKQRVKPEYKPEHIYSELDLAYGFDFYRPRATMLLRFNRDFSDRYIQNTDRHPTFKQINLKKAKDFIQRQLKTDTDLDNNHQKQLTNILDRNLEDTYYLLDYRVGDNNVIMRLRAWCPNVEIIYPWNLRQRMREDIEQTWRLYESDR